MSGPQASTSAFADLPPEDLVMAPSPKVEEASERIWGKGAKLSNVGFLSFASAGRAMSPNAEAVYGRMVGEAHVKATGSIPPVHLAASFNEVIAFVPPPYRVAAAPLLNRAKATAQQWAEVRDQLVKFQQAAHKGGKPPPELEGVHAPTYQHTAAFDGKEYRERLGILHAEHQKACLQELIKAKEAEEKTYLKALEPQQYAGHVQSTLSGVYAQLKKREKVLSFKASGGELEPIYEADKSDAIA
ncbi:hypothetical protein FS837_005889, partial [Tulasnella sp. UAMH 9824]